MKIGKLKSDRRLEMRNDKSLGIQTYGGQNDYPQQVMQIVEASVSGKPCVGVYAKFIAGNGFADKDFYTKVLNRKGHTVDFILNQLAKDFALFGGFALHINYNALFQTVEIQNIPFETVRFEKLDDNGFFSRVAIHWDWARQYGNLRRWKKEDIAFIDSYNPDPAVIENQVETAGGWENYNGQVFYFSNEGEKTYPLPIFNNVLTDMNTQEGISNVSNRNARKNFLPSGMLIDKVNRDKSEEQNKETEKAFLDFQGDEKACKILRVEIEDESEKPEFVPFTANNYDKQFDVTRKAVRDDIGIAFNQPPILRAQDVGANFGADLMQNAYNYYNSVIGNERLEIERCFTAIFKNWYEPVNGDYSILPLEYTIVKQNLKEIPPEFLSILTVNEKRELLGYDNLLGDETEEITLAEKIGVGGVQSITAIISDPALSESQKKGILKVLFSLTEKDLQTIFNKKP
jgi:hypothetical protein